MPIRKTKQGYKIDNVEGVSPSREHAEKRLRAIKEQQRRKQRRQKKD